MSVLLGSAAGALRKTTAIPLLALALAAWAGLAPEAAAAASATDAANAVPAAALVTNSARYDGRPVYFRGEAIGTVMRRGTEAVVNVLDGGYAVGVWVSAMHSSEIRLTGRYGVTGDIVEIRGTFQRACREHGADPDIHAESLTVLRPGRVVPQPFHQGRALAAGGGVLLALALAGWERRRRAPDPDSELLGT